MGFSYRTSRFSLLNVLPLLVWSTGPAQRAPQCPHDSGTTSGISCILLTWRMSLSLTYDPESNDLVIRWLQCFAQHFSLNMDILFHHSCTRHRCSCWCTWPPTRGSLYIDQWTRDEQTSHIYISQMMLGQTLTQFYWMSVYSRRESECLSTPSASKAQTTRWPPSPSL